jgi:hypothetical protein
MGRGHAGYARVRLAGALWCVPERTSGARRPCARARRRRRPALRRT